MERRKSNRTEDGNRSHGHGTVYMDLFVFVIVSQVAFTEAVARGFFFSSDYTVNFTSKTYTSCIKPLTECPQSEVTRKGREMCLSGYKFESCKPGTHYNCGRDKTNGFLVEACFEQKVCDPGSASEVRLDTKTEKASLLCVPCEKGTYQPFKADSVSRTGELKGCQFKKSSLTLEEEIPRMILIEQFGPFGPDQYSCDSSQGYSDSNRKMYCYVNDMCHCTRDFRCMNSSLPELLPDESCDRKCAGNRDKSNNFTCTRYASSDMPPTDNGSLSPYGKKDDEGRVPLIAGTIATAFVAIVIIVWYIYHRVKRKKSKEEERTTDGGIELEEINSGEHDENVHGIPGHQERVENTDENAPFLNQPKKSQGMVVNVNTQNYFELRKPGNVNVLLPQPYQVDNLEETKDKESLVQPVQEQGGLSLLETDGKIITEPQMRVLKDIDDLDEASNNIIPDDRDCDENTFSKRLLDED